MNTIRGVSLFLGLAIAGSAAALALQPKDFARQWPVLAKLMFVDRTYMGNMPGIISFIAVGLLLVGVGWLAPQPPRTLESGGQA